MAIMKPDLALLIAVSLMAADMSSRSVHAAGCKRILRSPLSCTDGDPTCDLDHRPDRRCIIALCNTGTTGAPRPSFCTGSLTWTTLYSGRVGRTFVARAGRCPVSRRRVSCRPAADPRPLGRTCTLSVDAPTVSTGPTTTHCRIDALRFERQPGHVTTQLNIHFPDAPFRADGQNGWLVVEVLSPLDVGVFAFGDPVKPLGGGIGTGAVGTIGGQSIPIVVERARLEIDEVSRASTIWTDDVHGTLDLDQIGGPLDPRRVVLHLEF